MTKNIPKYLSFNPTLFWQEFHNFLSGSGFKEGNASSWVRGGQVNVSNRPKSQGKIK